MVRFTIKLLVFALLAHAAYRVVPPFWNFFQFRDAVQEAATFADTPSLQGRRMTRDQVLDKLAQAAQNFNIPVGRDDFQLTMTPKLTTVDLRYTVRLEYLPRQYRPHEFVVHAEGGASRYAKTAD